MTIPKLTTTRYVLVILFVLMLCTTSLFAAAKLPSGEDFPLTVQDLRVHDIPNDEGSGVRIEWTPLPFEARIISYRVYRGVTPDSLFFIGDIPVNPRIRLTSTTMSFYDRNYNSFMNIVSPGKVKQERRQPEGSPLYRALPRDLNVMGPMLKYYDLLGVIPNKTFYFNTTLQEQDEKFFAGVKPNQMTVLKKLKPGDTYYYTVVAVNERRVFFPHAELAKGVAIFNPPENPHPLHGVYLEDTNTLQFEWEIPVYWADFMRHFGIYAVENEESYADWKAEYQQWKNDYDDWAENFEAKATKEETRAYVDEQARMFKERQDALTASNPATLIWRYTLPRPWTPNTYAKIDLVQDENGNNAIVKTSEWGIDTTDFTFEKSMDEYRFVLAYNNDINLMNFSNAYPVRISNDLVMPEMPAITIRDQKNDKGDYMEFFWGKPFARITSVSYLNKSRTKAQFNYEFSTNDDHKIRNIYFEITDNAGNLITRKNEFYQSGIFRVRNIPADTDELNIKIWFKTKQQGEDTEHFLTQKLKYEPDILSLRPQELVYNGFNVNDYSVQIIRRTSFYNSFRMSSKVGFFNRVATDLVQFESNIFTGVTDYCLDRNMFLVNYNIDVVYDFDAKSHMRTPMFASEVEPALEVLRNQVAEYHNNFANAETDAERDNWQMYIDYYGGNLNALENNETMQFVNSHTHQRARARAIRGLRETERRKMTYQVMLSDGKGMLKIEDITVDENGEPYFVIPIPNWFQTERIPMLIASLIFGLLVSIFIQLARKGKNLYIRPIAGIEEIDNAIGRATEMGRPILFCPGLSGIGDVATLAGLSILSRVAQKAAEYDTRILVPCRDYIVLPIAQEIVREAHSLAGRPDSFDKNNVFFVSEQQFAYVAGVNGIMVREKTATNFYMGMFWAESLIMTETGNQTGAIQIAGTDAATQIPFFITTCDYTLIGEELYAASAYMSRQPLMLGTLKAQDYTKFIILMFLVFGTLFSTFGITTIIDWFPSK